MAAAARMASATSLPATKRVETRWPRRERSATARRDRLSDRAINVALSTAHLIFAGWDCQRRSLFLTWHYSIFYHKLEGVAVRGYCSVEESFKPRPRVFRLLAIISAGSFPSPVLSV